MSVNITEGLNSAQADAVTHTEGPLLILAGAGSGKTKVLTARIAYLISEKHVRPYNILAITFTNKAAGEMKERVWKTAGEGSAGVFVGTFHAACVRILRQHAEVLGYTSRFTIYDSDDSVSLMKQILKRFNLETRDLKRRTIQNIISHAKDNLEGPDEWLSLNVSEYNADRIGKAYKEYQKALLQADAMDFDDLIFNTVKLFTENRDILGEYQERFRYICVDEYQDTNNAQFELIRLLAEKYKNLCVVGDDDQSIYRFRGANIRNILDFERNYPEAYVVKLEQNYRSTQTILDAANNVIRNNRGRKEKTLWSELGQGESIRVRTFVSAPEEADFIADDIVRGKREYGFLYHDTAVLYRTNMQSRLLEERLVRDSIPYELVGGVSFYARREIKDILSYLRFIENGKDEVALTRIINVPKRGIGQTTLEKCRNYAVMEDTDTGTALLHAEDFLKGKTLEKIREFMSLISRLRELSTESGIDELIRSLIDMTDYEDYLLSLDADKDEALFSDEAENARLLNVEELISKAAAYQEEAGEDASLSGFLEDVALVADIDLADDTSDRVMLMTLHSAKGLEFERVYIAGMEEEVFPSYQACEAEYGGDRAAMEEERRLAYVGITRAKKLLTLTAARGRMINGEIRNHAPSRFLDEIPDEFTSQGGTLNGYGRQGTRAAVTRKARGFSGGGARTPFAAQAARELNKISGESGKISLNKGMPEPVQPSYKTGDRVRHIKFGDGTVTDMQQEKRDVRVTVDFDAYGQKIMYSMFAKLEKI